MAIRIPIVENQAGVSATTFRDPASAAAPWRALEGFGQDIQGAANRLVQQEAELKEKKKRIEDANFLSELNLSLAEENEKIIEQEKKAPDATKYFENWQTKFKKVAQARVDSIKDPELKARAKLEATQFEVGEIRTQKHYGNVLWLQTQQARTERILDGYAKRGDKESGLRQIENDVLNGILTPTQGEDQKKKFGKDVEKSQIIAATHSNDPESAGPLIDASAYIDETEKSTLKAAARDKARTVKKQIEEDTRQEAVDRVYKSLKSDWGDNYEMMFVSLANPQFQEENKLDLTGKHTLEQLLGQEQQRREYQIRKAHDENWAKVMPRLIDQSLPAVTPQELAEYSRTNGLSQDQLAYAKHQIGISPQDKPIHTDNSYWAQMFEGIKAGKDMRSQILEGGKPSLRKLSSSDVHELYRLQAARDVEGKAHYTSDPWFHIAEQQFRERLIGTIHIDPQEAIEAKVKGQPIKQVKDSTFYYEALTTLMRSIEFNKLKGEDIWKKGQELLNVYAVKQATQGEAAFSMPEPPDPKANKGRYIQDAAAGKVKRSNGKEWIDVEIH